MITYKAIFKLTDGGVHAEVVDFPGAISCGKDLDDARLNLAGALTDMAESLLLCGEPLPTPNPDTESEEEPDLEEPIHLILQASTRIQVTPETRAS